MFEKFIPYTVPTGVGPHRIAAHDEIRTCSFYRTLVLVDVRVSSLCFWAISVEYVIGALCRSARNSSTRSTMRMA